jgi:hypothetical protein
MTQGLWVYAPEQDEEDAGSVVLAMYDTGQVIRFLTPTEARALAQTLLVRADYAEEQEKD